MSAPGQILVVDDEPQICGLIRDALASEGMPCVSVTSSSRAQGLVRDGGYDVVITDLAMPQTTGLDLLAQARSNAPDCKVILITAFASEDSLAGALRLGAYDFLEKPFDVSILVQSVRDALSGHVPPLPARAAHAMQTAQLQRQTHLESIQALAQAVEAKDPYTRRHGEQVAYYAGQLARQVGMTAEELGSLHVATLLHDVGKIGVPDHILTKPGALTDEEFSYIRKHPLLGSRILENISVFTQEAGLVRHHHENWDGSGYPDGLAGEDIPQGARIINIADSIDAMLMKRVYKDAYGVEKMLSELQRGKGRQFDPALADMAINWCRNNLSKLILPA